MTSKCLKSLRLGLLISLAMAGSPQAQDLFYDEDIVINATLLCIGRECFHGEADIPGGLAGLKVNDPVPAIYFDDTSLPLGIPDHDWQIRVNTASGPDLDNFQIEDVTAGTVPFNIKGLAPTDALVIGADGAVGLGTGLPQKELHVLDGNQPTLRLEQDGTSGFSPQIWDAASTLNGFQINDITAGTSPFLLRFGADSFSVVVADNGNVGLGRFVPQGKLHTYGDGTQLVYFESGDGGAVQVRFRTDSENRRFLAVDNSNTVKTQMQFKDDAILFLGQTVAQEWLRVDATGITTAGPSCGSPCDLTFDSEHFTVPPIEERAARMWQNKHLPAIGPTSPDQPMNLTEKMGGVIHELEVAHIYIEDLHARLAMQDAKISELMKLNVTLVDRLDALEAR